MSILKKDVKAEYPIPVYNYQVVIDGTTHGFSSVSGLTREFEKVVYKHGLSFLEGYEIIRGQQQVYTIQLSRGITSDPSLLYAWLNDNSEKDFFIDLCDLDGKTIVRWKVVRARPTKLTAPNFDASSNEIAIENLEILAQELQVEYL